MVPRSSGREALTVGDRAGFEANAIEAAIIGASDDDNQCRHQWLVSVAMLYAVRPRPSGEILRPDSPNIDPGDARV